MSCEMLSGELQIEHLDELIQGLGVYFYKKKKKFEVLSYYQVIFYQNREKLNCLTTF